MRVTSSWILGGAACVLLSAIPVAAASRPAARQAAWPAETISGTIQAVEPGQRLIVVQGPNQVPFDLVVTGKTQIEAGNHAVSLKDLTQYQNQSVSVRFIPERGGDVARSIRIVGS